MLKLKDNLKRERERNGFTRSQMAKQLNITPTAYGAYELGIREPKLDKLCQISRILHTSPNELLGFSSKKQLAKPKELDNLRFLIQDTGCTLEDVEWRMPWEKEYRKGFNIVFPNKYRVVIDTFEDLKEICRKLLSSKELRKNIKEARFLELKRILIDYGVETKERRDKELEQYLDSINAERTKDGEPPIIAGVLPIVPPNKKDDTKK